MKEAWHTSCSPLEEREQFIQGGKAALSRNRNSDTRDREIEDLKKIIGDQSLVIDAFKKTLRGIR